MESLTITGRTVTPFRGIQPRLLNLIDDISVAAEMCEKRHVTQDTMTILKIVQEYFIIGELVLNNVEKYLLYEQSERDMLDELERDLEISGYSLGRNNVHVNSIIATLQ